MTSWRYLNQYWDIPFTANCFSIYYSQDIGLSESGLGFTVAMQLHRYLRLRGSAHFQHQILVEVGGRAQTFSESLLPCWFDDSSTAALVRYSWNETEFQTFPCFLKASPRGEAFQIQLPNKKSSLAKAGHLRKAYDVLVGVFKGLNQPLSLRCSVWTWDLAIESRTIHLYPLYLWRKWYKTIKFLLFK